MFIKGPGERCHKSPPGCPGNKPNKETADPTFPESGSKGVGDIGEGLGLDLHPSLDDIGRLGGGGGHEASYQPTWQRVVRGKLIQVKNCEKSGIIHLNIKK